MKRFHVVYTMLCMVYLSSIAGSAPKHWHETKGFATDIKGGIGGEVYRVTNLNSSGAGSLKDAVSKGNRLVVFEVGGVIKGGFSPASNITIAGQTAPYPGITTVGGGVRCGGSNIVISHITHCMGKGGGSDAWNQAGKNIVLDHIAVYWGTDETLPIQGANNITLYKCLIAEGLQFTGHGDGEHSKGLHIQINNTKLSVIGCLNSNCAIRVPRIDKCVTFLSNHVVYNWGPAWDHIGPKLKSQDDLKDCPHCFNKVISGFQANITLVGSIGLSGPESKAQFLYDGHNTTTKGYLNDNIIKDRQGNDLKQANTEGVPTGGLSGKDGAVTLLDTPPIWPEGYEPLPAHEALYEVLRTVGPQPGNRNPQNARQVRTVADDNGMIIDHQNEVGGYPDYTPTSRKLGTIPDGAEARQAWLDSIENEIAVDKKIDLSRLYTMVGSKASDIYGPETSVNRNIYQKADGFGIKITQGNSRNKQLHASFNLSITTPVSMKLFDPAGNTVAQKPRSLYNAGINEITMNLDHLPAGLYICRIQIGNTLTNHIYNNF